MSSDGESNTMDVEGEEEMVAVPAEGISSTDLSRLFEMLGRSAWTVPSNPDQQWRPLLDAAIAMVRDDRWRGDDGKMDERLVRFLGQDCLQLCVHRVLVDQAVLSWQPIVLRNVYTRIRQVLNLCAVMLRHLPPDAYDHISLSLLNVILNSSNDYYPFFEKRQADRVPDSLVLSVASPSADMAAPPRSVVFGQPVAYRALLNVWAGVDGLALIAERLKGETEGDVLSNVPRLSQIMSCFVPCLPHLKPAAILENYASSIWTICTAFTNTEVLSTMVSSCKQPSPLCQQLSTIVNQMRATLAILSPMAFVGCSDGLSTVARVEEEIGGLLPLLEVSSLTLIIAEMKTGTLSSRLQQMDILSSVFEECAASWRMTTAAICARVHVLGLVDVLCEQGIHLQAQHTATQRLLIAMLKCEAIDVDQIRPLWLCQFGGAHDAVIRNIHELVTKLLPEMCKSSQNAVVEWWVEACTEASSSPQLKQLLEFMESVCSTDYRLSTVVVDRLWIMSEGETESRHKSMYTDSLSSSVHACDVIAWLRKVVDKCRTVDHLLYLQLIPNLLDRLAVQPINRNHMSRHSAIAKVEEDCHVVEFFVNSIAQFVESRRSAEEEGDGIDDSPAFQMELRLRVRTLLYWLGEGQQQLCLDLAVRLWKGLIPCPADIAFRVFYRLAFYRMLSMEDVSSLYRRCIVTLPPTKYTRLGIKCLTVYMLSANVHSGRISYGTDESPTSSSSSSSSGSFDSCATEPILMETMRNVRLSALEVEGDEHMWMIMLQSDEETYGDVITLLTSLYSSPIAVDSNKDRRSITEHVLSIIDTKLQLYYRVGCQLAESGDSPAIKANVTKIYRLVATLNSYLRAFDAQFDGIHQCVRRRPPLNRARIGTAVTLHVTVCTNRYDNGNMYVLDCHSHMTMYEVRVELGHMLKNDSIYVNETTWQSCITGDTMTISALDASDRQTLTALGVCTDNPHTNAPFIDMQAQSSFTTVGHRRGVRYAEGEEEALPSCTLSSEYLNFLLRVAQMSCENEDQSPLQCAYDVIAMLPPSIDVVRFLLSPSQDDPANKSLAAELADRDGAHICYILHVLSSLVCPVGRSWGGEEYTKSMVHLYTTYHSSVLQCHTLVEPIGNTDVRLTAYSALIALAKSWLYTQVLLVDAKGEEDKMEARTLTTRCEWDKFVVSASRDAADGLRATGVVGEPSVEGATVRCVMHIMRECVTHFGDEGWALLLAQSFDVLYICSALCPLDQLSAILCDDSATDMFLHILRWLRDRCVSMVSQILSKRDGGGIVDYYCRWLFTSPPDTHIVTMLCHVLPLLRGQVDDVHEHITEELAWMALAEEESAGRQEPYGDTALLSAHLRLLAQLVRKLAPIDRAELGVTLVPRLISTYVLAESATYSLEEEGVARSATSNNVGQQQSLVPLRSQSMYDARTKSAVSVCSSSTAPDAFALLLALLGDCPESCRVFVTAIRRMFAHVNDDNIAPSVEGRSGQFVGLKNASATCYMNSVLQQLFMVDAVRTAVLHIDFGGEEIGENAQYDVTTDEGRKTYNHRLLHTIQTIFANLLGSQLQYFTPRQLWRELRIGGDRSVNVREQQDALELFNALVDVCDEGMTDMGVKPVCKAILGGQFADQKICTSCPHRYTRDEPFTSLSVNVRNQSNLVDSLQDYVKGDMLTGDNRYKCEKCDCLVDAVKRLCIKRLPPLLCIQLKRFDFDYDTMTPIKFNDLFEFPRKLDMTPYTARTLARLEGEAEVEGEDVNDYELRGVVVHSGQANGGHYYSYIACKRDDGRHEWFKFDDCDVQPCSLHLDDVLRRDCYGGPNEHVLDTRNRWWNAYIVMYERVNDCPSSLSCISLSQRMSQMPLQMREMVSKHNRKVIHVSAHLQLPYLEAIAHLMAVARHYEGEEELVCSVALLLHSTLIHVMDSMRRRIRGTSTLWVTAWRDLLGHSAVVRAYMAHLLAQSLFKYMIDSLAEDCRTVMRELWRATIEMSIDDGPMGDICTRHSPLPCLAPLTDVTTDTSAFMIEAALRIGEEQPHAVSRRAIEFYMMFIVALEKTTLSRLRHRLLSSTLLDDCFKFLQSHTKGRSVSMELVADCAVVLSLLLRLHRTRPSGNDEAATIHDAPYSLPVTNPIADDDGLMEEMNEQLHARVSHSDFMRCLVRLVDNTDTNMLVHGELCRLGQHLVHGSWHRTLLLHHAIVCKVDEEEYHSHASLIHFYGRLLLVDDGPAMRRHRITLFVCGDAQPSLYDWPCRMEEEEDTTVEPSTSSPLPAAKSSPRLPGIVASVGKRGDNRLLLSDVLLAAMMGCDTVERLIDAYKDVPQQVRDSVYDAYGEHISGHTYKLGHHGRRLELYEGLLRVWGMGGGGHDDDDQPPPYVK